MRTLRILTHPDPFLSTKAREITAEEMISGTADDVKLLDLVRNMLVTMYLNKGAGLAATQVGIGLRLFVADVSPGSNHPFHVVNPIISEPTGMETDLEGCLSVPGTKVDVQRAQSVLVTGFYIDGRPAMFRANGLMARLCQHETDHLDGVLFMERVASLGKGPITIIADAREFAILAHAGQKRKYTGEKYATHPIRVSMIAEMFGLSPQAVAAAALHDVKEDSPSFASQIKDRFGAEVSELVDWLTNPSKGSELPRAERKKMDREHLAIAPLDAKIIKSLDRLDNLQDIGLAPNDFKTTYLNESLLLADALMKGASSPLLVEIVDKIRKIVEIRK